MRSKGMGKGAQIGMDQGDMVDESHGKHSATSRTTMEANTSRKGRKMESFQQRFYVLEMVVGGTSSARVISETRLGDEGSGARPVNLICASLHVDLSSGKLIILILLALLNRNNHSPRQS